VTQRRRRCIVRHGLRVGNDYVPFGRVGLALAILWAGCVAISAVSGLVDLFVHMGVLRILGLGAGIVGALPLFLVMTPSFTGPPYIWSAGIFSLAVTLFFQAVRSLFLGQPVFGSFVIAAGVAILLALFSVWLGRLLWKAIKS
jgi:hypothetical protein